MCKNFRTHVILDFRSHHMSIIANIEFTVTVNRHQHKQSNGNVCCLMQNLCRLTVHKIVGHIPHDQWNDQGNCGAYIKLQSDVTARMKKIASLESQVTDLKADNDEAYKRINTAVDLDAIKEKAINELGMFYATQDQIVYYSVDKTDYMNQYNEIPQ